MGITRYSGDFNKKLEKERQEEDLTSLNNKINNKQNIEKMDRKEDRKRPRKKDFV